MQFAKQLKVTEALSNKMQGKEIILIVKSWFYFDLALINERSIIKKVYFYRQWSYDDFRWIRISALAYIIFTKLRDLKWLVGSLYLSNKKNKTFTNIENSNLPTLLLWQEDVLSIDRSYRTQPHWLFEKDGKPKFRTLILETPSIHRSVPDIEFLNNQNVFIVSKKDLFLYSTKHPVQKELNQSLWMCLYFSIFGSPQETIVTFQLTILLIKAYSLAGFCAKKNV